jgi:hypothetical protein
MFMKAVEGLKMAGATVVFDDAILPASFEALTFQIQTEPYIRQGLERFLQEFGPAEYHSSAGICEGGGIPASSFLVGNPLRTLETDPAAETNFYGPQRRALAAYQDTLERFHLDGFVYPALQMMPNDETIPQPAADPVADHIRVPDGQTRSDTCGGCSCRLLSNGLPFGLELSAGQWKDGDLLGWAFAFEQITQYRKPPVLTERQ